MVNNFFVALIGRVDAGKTSFIEKLILKNKNITKKEEGKITQKLRIYEFNNAENYSKNIISKNKEKIQELFLNNKIFFADSPGHISFEFIRQKILKLADITLIFFNILDKVEEYYLKII